MSELEQITNDWVQMYTKGVLIDRTTPEVIQDIKPVKKRIKHIEIIYEDN